MIAVLVFGCTTVEHGSGLPTDEEVKEFLASYERAIARHDWPSVRRCFLPTATVTLSEEGKIRTYSAMQWVDGLPLAVGLVGYGRERRGTVIQRDPSVESVLVRSRLVESALVTGGMMEISQQELMVLVRNGGRLQIAALGFEVSSIHSPNS